MLVVKIYLKVNMVNLMKEDYLLIKEKDIEGPQTRLKDGLHAGVERLMVQKEV